MLDLSRALNLDSVAAFVLASDFASFTRAAEALGTTQAAVSLHVKRLEGRLGRRLLERTPRSVRLSAEGVVFLPRARDLLSAHERAVADVDPARRQLRIGISEHVAGPELPSLIAKLRATDPTLLLEVRLGFSRDLLDAYDKREIDVAVIRGDDRHCGATSLFTERLGWFAGSHWVRDPHARLPLATLSTTCGVRSLAARLLDEAGIGWIEVFVGGGLAAVAAAVSAGLAIAPIPRRLAPRGAVEVTQSLGLPLLPMSQVVLLSQASGHRTVNSVRTLAAHFRREAIAQGASE